MRDVTDDLAETLFALETGGLSTPEVTSLITTGIVRWAHGHGWGVRTEARVFAVDGDVRATRAGFVDVIVKRGGDGPDLAIEIDSADKLWSVEKLRHAARGGLQAIWIRWGDDEWPGSYEDIDVIQLRITRRRQQRSVEDQLSIWR